MNAVNNLVEKDELVAWNRMKAERREHTITKLLHAVEESALTLANNYKTPAELQIKAADMGETVIQSFVRPGPPPVRHPLGNCGFFSLFSSTEVKLYMFDARQPKAKLSASMAGDHINLSPKLPAAKDSNGKVALLAFSNVATIWALGGTADSV